ncbi:MAG: Aspartate-semialdehyde dehydrogenase [Firmicutes bacterium ADurb.Bin248]|nr:MAG: Aspartate-semialdehyde dehydrogenase [Firmicutes bacterium ADurb.Bin248]HOG00275.1 aspartate-semialdehyde dehydrogenase [Clostridia bacterium]
MKALNVAVVGALGAVGGEMLKTLEQRAFPIRSIKPLDVAVNVSREIVFAGRRVAVQEAREGAFEDVDLALFSAGSEASLALAPAAVREGSVVVDNSSAWRMEADVPLVVPEVNPEALRLHKGIIANPNCSTIQMVVALKPLHELFKIRRVVVSTYQAVSGSGQRAIDELRRQAEQFCRGEAVTHEVYPYQILFNALPHIDVFLENGYTKEEMKMVDETHKILDPAIAVTATTVRIPAFRGHSESINIETERKADLAQAREALRAAKGVVLADDPQRLVYPLALGSEGTDDVYVGRLRLDESVENGMNFWVVADNLRKGAALNAVQIAEKMLEMNLI